MTEGCFRGLGQSRIGGCRATTAAKTEQANRLAVSGRGRQLRRNVGEYRGQIGADEAS